MSGRFKNRGNGRAEVNVISRLRSGDSNLVWEGRRHMTSPSRNGSWKRTPFAPPRRNWKQEGVIRDELRRTRRATIFAREQEMVEHPSVNKVF